mmetsp:Transcript_46284/g.88314  ORF Transcript_46284/g.88314 Transcript_46284/m.88314 type:complete len:301 (-) Transcript_46284:1619-2521(-)
MTRLRSSCNWSMSMRKNSCASCWSSPAKKGIVSLTAVWNSSGEMYALSPVFCMSSIRSAMLLDIRISLPMVDMSVWSSRSFKCGVCLKHCKALFMKQVLPRLVSPTRSRAAPVPPPCGSTLRGAANPPRASAAPALRPRPDWPGPVLLMSFSLSTLFERRIPNRKSRCFVMGFTVDKTLPRMLLLLEGVTGGASAAFVGTTSACRASAGAASAESPFELPDPGANMGCARTFCTRRSPRAAPSPLCCWSWSGHSAVRWISSTMVVVEASWVRASPHTTPGAPSAWSWLVCVSRGAATARG